MYYSNYLYNKTVDSIIKTKKPVYLQLQILNNNLMDGLILNDDEINYPYVLNMIKTINNPSTREYLIKRLEKTPLDPQDYQNITSANNLLNDVVSTISTTETERIENNAEYIKNVLDKADLDIARYQNLIDELPKTTSRVDILKESIEKKQMPPIPRDEELKSWYEQGGSYKTRYTYKQLDTFSKDIERYGINRIEQEQALMINRESVRNGGDTVYGSKTWNWSGKKDTRHKRMDNITIPIHEKFKVTNDKTGEIDYLLFPGDYVNSINPSNVVGCCCSVSYNTI